MILSLSHLVLLSVLTFASINAIAIDDFHCKVPTCRDFHYGLIGSSRRHEYVEVCYETVYRLQEIPTKYGKCIDDRTGRLHSPCIYELARTIKKCMEGLKGLPEDELKFYCGYTLMKYCAVHLGLEHFPLVSMKKGTSSSSRLDRRES